ncbi:MAG: hypothetical protein ACUVQQ_14020 [Thermogutta sp.]
MDFACSHCGQMLRVPDGSEGRSAKCPACGGLSTVPGGPSPANGGENWEKQAGFAGSGFVPDLAAYPTYDPQFQRRAALDRVAGPATGLIVCAILNIVLWVAITAFYSVVAFVVPTQEGMEGGPEEAMFLTIGMIVVYGTMGLLAIVANIVSIMGAVGMRKLRSRGFSMAAAILQMIPCFSSCWPLGLGMGIWALVVLQDPRVRAAFT